MDHSFKHLAIACYMIVRLKKSVKGKNKMTGFVAQSMRRYMLFNIWRKHGTSSQWSAHQRWITTTWHNRTWTNADTRQHSRCVLITRPPLPWSRGFPTKVPPHFVPTQLFAEQLFFCRVLFSCFFCYMRECRPMPSCRIFMLIRVSLFYFILVD